LGWVLDPRVLPHVVESSLQRLDSMMDEGGDDVKPQHLLAICPLKLQDSSQQLL
jgi:hypothetical protein